MIRLHEDVDGCGCVRCQDVDHEVCQRSLGGALVWSGALPFVRPSILFVLLAVGLVQVAAVVAPRPLSPALLGVAIVGVFVGRGYVGVVGRHRLGPRSRASTAAFLTVARRLPAFLGAALVLVLGLAGTVVVLVTVVSPAVVSVATAAGIDRTVAELAVVLALVAVIVYVLLKSCFLPEACFVGGYGPLGALRASWVITTVHRRKAGLIFGGFLGLLAIGALLDTQVVGTGAPVALSFEVGGTTVVLRSFGLSFTSGARFAFDLLVTAVYSGAFVHQYAEGAVSSRGASRPGRRANPRQR